VQEGTWSTVMQAGYVIGDRCSGPALVAVAKSGQARKQHSKARTDNGADRPAQSQDPITSRVESRGRLSGAIYFGKWWLHLGLVYAAPSEIGSGAFGTRSDVPRQNAIDAVIGKRQPCPIPPNR